MLKLKEGDRVRIADRAATPADAKSGLFYNYYRGLPGTVFKLYGRGEAAQAAIEVDIDALPEDVARRHLDTRDRMRASLTGEAKRLSAPGAEQEFHLRYIVLVAASDLQRKTTPPAPRSGHTNGANGKAA